jgi:uncharacterized phage-like protein YoqJ
VIIGVTGHRDAGQGPGELERFARFFVAHAIRAGVSEIITGMALGWDLAVAEAADWAGVPFLAAIPFPSQADRWSFKDQMRYAALVAAATRTVIASSVPGTAAYLKRDRWIVDQCDELWSLDSGRRSGTHTTVLYAEATGRKVVPLWDDWVRSRG